MKELRTLLESVEDSYSEFVSAVEAYVCGRPEEKEKVKTYIQKNPEATTSDVLSLLCLRPAFWEMRYREEWRKEGMYILLFQMMIKDYKMVEHTGLLSNRSKIERLCKESSISENEFNDINNICCYMSCMRIMTDVEERLNYEHVDNETREVLYKQIRKEHLKEMLEDDACKYLTGAIKYVFRHELSQL